MSSYGAMSRLAARAEAFWRATPSRDTFPREIERAIAHALPVAVIRLPHLTVAAVTDWLRHRGVGAPCQLDCRPLSGCLFAHGGHGLVFVDGGDSPDELRFVLAHEVSHFILHHVDPRRRAVANLGDSVLEVLDGERPPTASERLAGVLRGVRLGEYLHAIEREPDGRIPSGDVARMETEADLLAFELLAPMASVRQVLSLGRGQPDRSLIAILLQSRFGLPRRAAQDWASQIAARFAVRPRFVDWLAEGS